MLSEETMYSRGELVPWVNLWVVSLGLLREYMVDTQHMLSLHQISVLLLLNGKIQSENKKTGIIKTLFWTNPVWKSITHVLYENTQHRSWHNKDNLSRHGGLTSSNRSTFIITSPVRIYWQNSVNHSTDWSFMSWTQHLKIIDYLLHYLHLVLHDIIPKGLLSYLMQHIY